ncbi:MAG TPA: hypothetical protein VMX57_08340 [Planctomycetota bacterium]|nr:hypothetical protein [Planctomycetota bacterium]
MKTQFNCPHCNKRLAVDVAHVGKKSRCPVCRNPLIIPPPTPEATPVEPVSTAPPVSHAPATFPTTSPGPAASRAVVAQIDLKQTQSASYADKQTADAEVLRIKGMLPEVVSAYSPSGRLPGSAFALLVVGGVLGIPAGAIAGTVILGLTLLAVLLLVLVIGALSEGCGVIWCLPVFVLIIVGLGGYAVTYIGVGAAAAACVAGMGRLGKNRNVPITIVLALVSAFLAIIVFRFPLGMLASLASDSEGDLAEGADAFLEMGPLAWIFLVVGLVIALVAAAMIAKLMVEGAKFCEDCEEYMEHWDLKNVTLGGAVVLVDALRSSDLAAAVDVLATSAGQDAAPKLFACPRCGRGYVELTFNFSGKYSTGEGANRQENTLEQSWLTNSQPLTPQQVLLFRPHVTQKGKS